ncbi:MAG TPA: ABC transporter ATP-binding protein [Thermoanaerobaculia bacterium]|nr:ABC transporter ATP-binding protein [Thermoanaerobaculia bacterium]
MTSESTVIRSEGLTVRFRREVVRNVTLSVDRGTVYALLGRNGAGKSSLVRCILGQLRPASGRVHLFGDEAWSRREALMKRVGVVPEDADAPAEMTVDQLARFCSRLYPRWEQSGLDERLGRTGIDPKQRFGELSKGQKKQVTLALALASAPELLILDDPTLGLDVVARKSLFEEIIGDLADRGTTVMITTHDLSGIEAIADRVGILQEGALVLDEETEALKSRFRRIRCASESATLSSGRLAATRVRRWGSGMEAVVSNYDEIAFAGLCDAGTIDDAEVVPMTLEEIFIAVAGEPEGAES